MPLLTPPRPVLEIAERLEGEGFEAWCVGGAVRDALLGHPHLDWDLATSATPDQIRALFGARRTIPIGIEFGTVGVLDRDRRLHEVTTFRRDVRTDGRHAVVEFGVSLHDDLARRDFTINAIAYSPRRDEIRDPFGGQADLERRVVRAVGDPDARMREDRLRALRAIRFAARFGFAIEPATLDAIRRSAPHLGRLSAERVKQELEKTMDQVARPSAALRLWRDSGALATLVPALAGVEDRVLDAIDCLAMPGLPTRPRRRLDRLAMLFLETADPTTVLSALKFSKQDTSWIAGLVATWRDVGSELVSAIVSDAPPPDAQVRRWVARIGRLRIGALMRILDATIASSRKDVATRDRPARQLRALYRRMLRSALRDPLTVADLAVDGDDLRRSGIAPGPVLGKILQRLLDAVLEDPSRNATDWLLQEAKRIHRELGGGGDSEGSEES
jgi:tRNA nucleotidyltransferase (CCA-adding enzyme)